MRKYLLSIVYILSLFVLPHISFAGKIYSIILGDVFESGSIEANSNTVQTQTFPISQESTKWFAQANIYPKEFHNEKIYLFPYKVYLAINEGSICYEEFNLYVLPLSSLIIIERKIINLTSQAQNYSNYGGTLIKYKLR